LVGKWQNLCGISNLSHTFCEDLKKKAFILVNIVLLVETSHYITIVEISNQNSSLIHFNGKFLTTILLGKKTFTIQHIIIDFYLVFNTNKLL
jgi:hypothetical protein